MNVCVFFCIAIVMKMVFVWPHFFLIKDVFIIVMGFFTGSCLCNAIYILSYVLNYFLLPDKDYSLSDDNCSMFESCICEIFEHVV